MKNFLIGLLIMLYIPCIGQVYKSGYVSLYNQYNNDWVHIQSDYQNHSFTITSTKIYWQTPDRVVYYNIQSVQKLETTNNIPGLLYVVSGENSEILNISITTNQVSLVYFTTEIPFALVFKIIQKI